MIWYPYFRKPLFERFKKKKTTKYAANHHFPHYNRQDLQIYSYLQKPENRKQLQFNDQRTIFRKDRLLFNLPYLLQNFIIFHPYKIYKKWWACKLCKPWTSLWSNVMNHPIFFHLVHLPAGLGVFEKREPFFPRKVELMTLEAGVSQQKMGIIHEICEL